MIKTRNGWGFFKQTANMSYYKIVPWTKYQISVSILYIYTVCIYIYIQYILSIYIYTDLQFPVYSPGISLPTKIPRKISWMVSPPLPIRARICTWAMCGFSTRKTGQRIGSELENSWENSPGNLEKFQIPGKFTYKLEFNKNSLAILHRTGWEIRKQMGFN